MKKIFNQRLSFIFCFIALFIIGNLISLTSKGQASCSALQAQLTHRGQFLPNPLPDGSINNLYTQNIAFRLRKDTAVNIPFPPFILTIPMDSAIITGINILPAGINFTGCDVANCTYILPDSLGCLTINGTPTVGYNDSIEIQMNYHVTILGIPTTFAEIVKLPLKIIDNNPSSCFSLQTQLTFPGQFLPNPLPDGCINNLYTQNIAFRLRKDTAVNIPFPPFILTIPMDSAIITGINILPAGINFTGCDVANCTYILPDSLGCLTINGTPTVVYNDSIEIQVNYHVTILGIPTTFAETVKLPLEITSSCAPVCSITSVSFSNVSECNNNGTPANPTDDFYTADLNVNFINQPAAGTLRIEPGNPNVLDVVEIPVASLVGNSHIFTGVRLRTTGSAFTVQVEFSADNSCSHTATAAAVNSCSTVTPPPVGGFLPNPLPDGFVNNAYFQNITFQLKTDTTIAIPFPPFLLTIPMDSVIISGINNLPAGINFNGCNIVGCTYILPTNTGSLTIGGTPTVAYNDSIEIQVNYHVTILGIPTLFAEIAKLPLKIIDSNPSSCSALQSQLTYRGQFLPNPLPDGCINNLYAQNIAFRLRKDTVIAIPFPPFSLLIPMDSAIITGINVLPVGINFTGCNIAGCHYISPGNTADSTGCLTISGTPTIVYNDSIEIQVQYWVTILGQPTPLTEIVKLPLEITSTCSSPCTLTCPANITTSNDLNQCGVVVNYPVPTTSGNCGIVTVSPASGSFFPIGATTVTATSSLGPTCTFTITVNDTQAPVITTGIIVGCYSNVAAAEAAALAATTATDNCPGVLTEVASTVGTCSAIITVTVTDANGNSAFTNYNTRIDNVPPTVTAGTIASCYLTVAAAEAAALASTTATDNCPGALVETVSTVGTCSAVVTVTTTDGCGNATSLTYNTRIDNVPPTVTAGTIASCYLTVAAAEAAALASTTATDNCPGALVETVSTVGTCSAVVTVTTIDGCGNSTSITYNTRIDNITPTLICPASVAVGCASAVPAPNIASVTGLSDNCSGAVTVTHQGDVISNQTCANRFTITRTYRATDGCGNFAECTQIITVNDQTAPTITCPAALTVSCASTVPAPNIASVTGVSDNCGGVVTVIHQGDVISNQTCANRFTITRTYRATDICGNFGDCTQIITVNDQTAPVITCPGNITATTPIGSCVAVVNFTPTATDNCGGTPTIVSVPASGFTFPIGTTTVTSTATDACGNTSSCTFTVTILDGQLPAILSQSANRTVCAGSNATFSVTATNVVSYQWQQWNGSAWTNIPGATASSFTVINATISMNTNSFRVILTGLCTVVTSNHGSLFVNPLPVISLNTSPPPSLLPNQTTTITAIVNPSGGNFVWSMNGSPITGVTGSVLGPLGVDDIGTYRTVYTDVNGCVTTSSDIVISGLAGDNLWVYPNPNQGQFNVRYFNQNNETLSLNIFNVLGQKIFQRNFVTTTAYSLIEIKLDDSLPDGEYIVVVINSAGKRVGSKKIVVKNP